MIIILISIVILLLIKISKQKNTIDDLKDPNRQTWL